MASSGNFTTSSSEGRSLTFNWSIASQSIANNQTTINWSLVGSGSYTGWVYSGNFKVTINGQQVYYSTSRIKLYQNTNVASGQFTFNNNNDGTGSFSAYAEAGIYYTAVNCSGSGSWSVPTIPRVSQPSINTYPNNSPNVNIGSNILIHMNRKTNDFTHTVRYAFGTLSGTIATGVGDNVNWVVPTTFYAQIPNSNSGTGTIYVDTYLGSSFIGTASCSMIANVTNSNPTFTTTYEDINSNTIAITTNNQDIIRGHSTLKINIANATALNSASLVSANVSLLGLNYSSNTFTSGATSIQFGSVNSSSNVTAVVSVVDTRGNTTSINLPTTVLDYVAPSALYSLNRENNFYSTSYLTVNGDIASLNSKNIMTIKYRIKQVTSTNYSDYVTIEDNVKTTFVADNTYEWNVQILVSDLISSTTYNLILQKGIPLLYFDTMNNSVGINCFPQHQSTVEINGYDISNISQLIATGTLGNVTTATGYNLLTFNDITIVNNNYAFNNGNYIILSKGTYIVNLNCRTSDIDNVSSSFGAGISNYLGRFTDDLNCFTWTSGNKRFGLNSSYVITVDTSYKLCLATYIESAMGTPTISAKCSVIKIQ